MPKTISNHRGFTLVGAVVTAGLVGLVGLMAVRGLKVTSTIERTNATGAEATSIENAVQMLLEDKCSCEQSGLIDLLVDVNNPAATSFQLGNGELIESMSPGDSIGRFRGVSMLTLTEMEELQTLASGNVVYWTSVLFVTQHKKGKIKGPETQSISIPLKVEVDLSTDPDPDKGTIVACYSKSSADCSTPPSPPLLPGAYSTISVVFEDAQSAGSSAWSNRDISFCIQGSFDYDSTSRIIINRSATATTIDVRVRRHPGTTCRHMAFLEVYSGASKRTEEAFVTLVGAGIESTTITVLPGEELKIGWIANSSTGGTSNCWRSTRDYHLRTASTPNPAPIVIPSNGACLSPF